MLDEDEDEEDEDDDEDEDIDEDDEDMDFKMVFVVNKSLELRAGIMSLYVAKSTAGLFKKINAQPQSVSSSQNLLLSANNLFIYLLTQHLHAQLLVF